MKAKGGGMGRERKGGSRDRIGQGEPALDSGCRFIVLANTSESFRAKIAC